MRFALFVILALILALIDHVFLAQWPAAPELSLAFAAWAMVDGDEDGVVWRALAAGMARELVEPAGNGFQVIGLLGLAILFLPMRRFFFRARSAAWAVWGGSAFLILRSADGMLTGFGDQQPAVLVVGACGTALAAVAAGWLFGGLPAAVRPIPPSGA